MSAPPDSPPRTRAVDVLVAGGGPTGLVVSYNLLKAGLSVLNVEQHDKEQQALYGRACMLYPRSLEILDQLGLFEPIEETGYVTRGAVTYKGREELNARGWTFVQKAITGNTTFDYCFSIRQKLIEEAFRGATNTLDSNAFQAPAKLVDFSVDANHAYPVTTKIQTDDGSIMEIRSKYLVGADGGRSTVRSLSKIHFPGTATPFRWVRLDAIVRTDLPSSRRGAVTVESSTHGNILWTPTDNGRTRIGFLCPDELYGENGENIDADAIMAVAKIAVKPFSLEFVQLDWWTVYAIGQRVAETFRDGPVLLAGDAAHTHSSGAAQGVNTGIHDASNLSWKLAGVLKGWFSDDVLNTYDTERRATANKLIQLDKDVASLLSGVIPRHFNAPPDTNVHDILEDLFTSHAAFTVGLGIHYEENLVNQQNVSMNGTNSLLRVQIGHRAPDLPVFRPGASFPKRLQELTPNCGKFWVLVFPGGLDPASEQPRLRQESIGRLSVLRSYITGPLSFTRALAPAFEFLTIVQGDRILQTAETLGGQPVGKAVHDRTGEVYNAYGVDQTNGGIIVLRPDGIVGFVAAMGQFEAVGQYFAGFVRPLEGREEAKVDVKLNGSKLNGGNVALGEISLEGKAEETQLAVDFIV